MAIEKGAYQAPEGLPEEEINAVIDMAIATDADTPVMVELENGEIEVTLGGEPADTDMIPFDANLAEYLDDGMLTELSSELIGHVEADTSSRKEWADTFVKGLDVVGFKYEERTEPWENACGVYSNVLAEAAIRFQAEAMSETCLLYTSPSPRDRQKSRMPSSA